MLLWMPGTVLLWAQPTNSFFCFSQYNLLLKGWNCGLNTSQLNLVVMEGCNCGLNRQVKVQEEADRQTDRALAHNRSNNRTADMEKKMIQLYEQQQSDLSYMQVTICS